MDYRKVRKALLTVRGISKAHSLGGACRSVLENVDLEIMAGDRISLVGPNGSGKTTLLRIILAIEFADRGRVEPILAKLPFRVSYVPQDYRNALFPWLTMRRNLALAFEGKYHDLLQEREEEYNRLAAAYRVSVGLDKYPYQLSGGEQQIFLLLRALISCPRLLILDEPLSAVDFGRRRLIHEHLSTWLAENDVTLMFATHDFEEAVLLADRVVILARDTPRIKVVLPINLDWPRSLQMRSSAVFVNALATITQELL